MRKKYNIMATKIPNLTRDVRAVYDALAPYQNLRGTAQTFFVKYGRFKCAEYLPITYDIDAESMYNILSTHNAWNIDMPICVSENPNKTGDRLFRFTQDLDYGSYNKIYPKLKDIPAKARKEIEEFVSDLIVEDLANALSGDVKIMKAIRADKSKNEHWITNIMCTYDEFREMKDYVAEQVRKQFPDKGPNGEDITKVVDTGAPGLRVIYSSKIDDEGCHIANRYIPGGDEEDDEYRKNWLKYSMYAKIPEDQQARPHERFVESAKTRGEKKKAKVVDMRFETIWRNYDYATKVREADEYAGMLQPFYWCNRHHWETIPVVLKNGGIKREDIIAIITKYSKIHYERHKDSEQVELVDRIMKGDNKDCSISLLKTWARMSKPDNFRGNWKTALLMKRNPKIQDPQGKYVYSDWAALKKRGVLQEREIFEYVCDTMAYLSDTDTWLIKTKSQCHPDFEITPYRKVWAGTISFDVANLNYNPENKETAKNKPIVRKTLAQILDDAIPSITYTRTMFRPYSVELGKFQDEFGRFNTFAGFRVHYMKPTGLNKEELERALEPILIGKIYNILCNKLDEQYKYVLHWLANLLHMPWRKARVALLFISEERAGKSTFFEWIFRWVIGELYAHAINITEATQIFNAHMKNKVLTIFDEVGSNEFQKHEDKFKELIVQPTIAIQGKNKDIITNVPCYTNIVGLTNYKYHKGIRKKVNYIRCSDEFCDKDEFHTKMANEVYFDGKNGTPVDKEKAEFYARAFYEYLGMLDYANWRPTPIPKTDMNQQTTVNALPMVWKFLYESVKGKVENFEIGDDVLPVSKREFIKFFRKWIADCNIKYDVEDSVIQASLEDYSIKYERVRIGDEKQARPFGFKLSKELLLPGFRKLLMDADFCYTTEKVSEEAREMFDELAGADFLDAADAEEFAAKSNSVEEQLAEIDEMKPEKAKKPAKSSGPKKRLIKQAPADNIED